MPNERDRKKEFDEAYSQAWSGFGSWQSFAREDLRSFLGDSLTEKEKNSLRNQNRDILFLQLIRRYVNWIHGYQCDHRMAIRFDPIEGSDKLTAAQLNGCLNVSMSNSLGYETISDAFKHTLKVGLSLVNAYNDSNFDTSLECLYYNQFLLDPCFTRIDLKDCQYGILRKYVSESDIKLILPDVNVDKIEKESKTGDLFPNYPYPNLYGKKLLSYDEFHQRTTKETTVILIKPLMKEIEWSGTKRQLEDLVPAILYRYNLQPEQISTFSRVDRTVDVSCFVNGQEVKHSQDPFGIGDFSFTPVIGVYDPEYDQMDMKLQGIVRRLVPFQKVSTKRLMAMLAWFDQQIGSGLDVESDALVDMEDAFKAGPGQPRIFKDGAISGNKYRERQIADLPSGFLATHQIINEMAPQSVSLNEDMFGTPQKDTELYGVVQQMRIGMGLIGNRGLFDNLSVSQKCIGQKMLKLIQQWPPEKVQRVLNQTPAPAFFTKDFGKYDCNVSEGLMTNTQRQTMYSELIQLKKMGAELQDPAPIPWKMIIKYAPVQVATDMETEIASIEQKNAQSQQRQQQIDMILQQLAIQGQRVQIENVKMDTAERQSRIAENQAETGFDRAQTMSELNSLEIKNQTTLLKAAIELEKLRVRKMEVGAKIMDIKKGNNDG